MSSFKYLFDTVKSYVEPCCKEKKLGLESRFGVEELQKIAKRESLFLFTYMIRRLYGDHHSDEAIEKLYKEARENPDALNAPILVKEGVKKALYKNETQEIWVGKEFVCLAKVDNTVRGELLVAIVEELGHHIHYLLDMQYGENKKRVALPGDVGARFANHVIRINFLEEKEQEFATFFEDAVGTAFFWEFSAFHTHLTQHVNHFRQNNQLSGAEEYDFFKAGEETTGHGQFEHRKIEREALFKILEEDFKYEEIAANEILGKIYLGNWMRDYSQLVDPNIIRPMANKIIEYSKSRKMDRVIESVIPFSTVVPSVKPQAPKDAMKFHKEYNKDTIDKTLVVPAYPKDYTLTGVNLIFPPRIEINVVYEYKFVRPVTWSRNLVTSAVATIALKEFVTKEQKSQFTKENMTKNGEVKNYVKLQEFFKKNYIDITPDVLGLYRPDEHIDNPRVILSDNPTENFDNTQLNLTNDNTGFVGFPTKEELEIGYVYGMKNYIRTDPKDAISSKFSTKRTAYELALEKLSSTKNMQSMINFGASLHILEDYFAHTNYVEIALAKVYSDRVFPWVDKIPKNKNHIGLNEFNYNKFAELNPSHAAMYLKSCSYVIEEKDLKIDKNLGRKANQIARYLPVVTGTFGRLDTVASLLPVMQKKFFSIEREEYKQKEPGERTLQDLFMLDVLRDLDGSQGLDGNGVSHTDKSKPGVLESIYLMKLALSDGKREIINETIPLVIRERIHFIFEYIGAMTNFMFYMMIKQASGSIADMQTYLEGEMKRGYINTLIGTDPTHTQVAKDDFDKVLHELAGLLAVEAVRRVGDKMFLVWDGGGTLKAVEDEFDVLMRHPATTTWQDKIIFDWAEKNKTKICSVTTPRVRMDSVVQTLEELYKFNEQLIKDIENKNKDGSLTSMEKTLQKFDPMNELKTFFKESQKSIKKQLEEAKILAQKERLKNNYYVPLICRQMNGHWAKDIEVYFDTDKTEILYKNELMEVLEKIVSKNMKVNVQIFGHADKRGSSSHNLSLSNSRALDTAEVIRKVLGKNLRLIRTEGYGESVLKYATNAQNRRAEIYLVEIKENESSF